MTIINSTIKGKQAVIDTLNVTPTTSAQTITAPAGTDGYSPVNVSAVTSSIDANIVAGNIKDGVSILGVTGNYSGITPTGTKSITANGVYDVTNYASADVQVPTTAPAHYIEKAVDANGKLINGSTIISFAGVTDIGASALDGAYSYNTSISGALDMSDLTQITDNNALRSAFAGCTGLTSVDLSSLTTVSGSSACSGTFNMCNGLTSVDLSSLETVSGLSGCYQMFTYCSRITGSLNLSSLTTIAASGCHQMFQNCTGITSVDLSSITGLTTTGVAGMFDSCSNLSSFDLHNLHMITASNSQVFRYTKVTTADLSGLVYLRDGTGSATVSGHLGSWFMGCDRLTSVDFSNLIGSGYSSNGTNSEFNSTFNDCTSLTTVSFPKMAKIKSMPNTFKGCTSLQTLYFGGLALNNYVTDNTFASMLTNCTGVTVHFPAEWETTMQNWTSVTNGFGGTNTTILFDLPNVRTVYVEKIQDLYESGNTPYSFKGIFRDCSAITSVHFSDLIRINNPTSPFRYAFNGCTSLTSVWFDSLDIRYNVDIDSRNIFYDAFDQNAAVSVYFPSAKHDAAIQTPWHFTYTDGITAIHLPSNMQGEIGDSALYVYDLPATNTLVGADTKSYERNPKYDTGTALGWYEVGTDRFTTQYYTSGLTDPTVGTTIYSDAACTQSVTTVSSIA